MLRAALRKKESERARTARPRLLSEPYGPLHPVRHILLGAVTRIRRTVVPSGARYARRFPFAPLHQERALKKNSRRVKLATRQSLRAVLNFAQSLLLCGFGLPHKTGPTDRERRTYRALSEAHVVSDQTIASVARPLAAALLAALAKRATDRAKAEEKRVAALQRELCAAYREEMIETLRV